MFDTIEVSYYWKLCLFLVGYHWKQSQSNHDLLMVTYQLVHSLYCSFLLYVTPLNLFDVGYIFHSTHRTSQDLRDFLVFSYNVLKKGSESSLLNYSLSIEPSLVFNAFLFNGSIIFSFLYILHTNVLLHIVYGQLHLFSV